MSKLVRLGRKAFTLIEVLVASALFSVVILLIYGLLGKGSETFNERLWENQTMNKLGVAAERLEQLLGAAAYPADNCFEGVIRDKSSNWALKVHSSNLSEGDAYSGADLNLTGGELHQDSSSVAEIKYFGGGLKEGLSGQSIDDNRYTNSNSEKEILTWTSCIPGYKNMPGFPDKPPRCGQHRLFLKNRQLVQLPAEGTYKSYQDLMLDTKYAVSSHLNPVNYGEEKGTYSPPSGAWADSKGGSGLNPEEINNVGRLLLCPNVTTVAVKIYQKQSHKSSTMIELDIIGVSPIHGRASVRKAIRQEIGVEVDH